MKKVMLFSLVMLFFSLAKAYPSVEVSKTIKTYTLEKKNLPLIEDLKNQQVVKSQPLHKQVLYFPKLTIQLSCASVTFTEAQSERIVIQAAMGGAMWLYGFYNSLEELACGGGTGNKEMVV